MTSGYRESVAGRERRPRGGPGAAWSSILVSAHPASFPEVSGDGRARLPIALNRSRPVGPPSGSVHSPAVWRAGRWSGSATVTSMPLSSTGFQLDVGVEAPDGFIAGMFWTRGRLERLARGLALALRDQAERVAPLPAKTRVPSASQTATSKWSFVSATGSSPSREAILSRR